MLQIVRVRLWERQLIYLLRQHEGTVDEAGFPGAEPILVVNGRLQAGSLPKTLMQANRSLHGEVWPTMPTLDVYEEPHGNSGAIRRGGRLGPAGRLSPSTISCGIQPLRWGFTRVCCRLS